MDIDEIKQGWREKKKKRVEALAILCASIAFIKRVGLSISLIAFIFFIYLFLFLSLLQAYFNPRDGPN